MVDKFSTYIDAMIDVYENSIFPDSRPNGDFFNSKSPVCLSNLLNKEDIFIERLKGNQGYLSLLRDERYFNFPYCSSKMARCLFWSLFSASIMHWNNGIRYNRSEETLTQKMLDEIASSMSKLSTLDDIILSDNSFFLYYADCKSDRTESFLGSDVAVIIPVGQEKFNVALFQAKKVDNPSRVSIERRSPKKTDFQQITRLLDVEGEFTEYLDGFEQRLKSINIDDDFKITEKMCFYLFWHKLDSCLLPTVLSAQQINHQLFKVDGKIYHSKDNNPVLCGDMNINPLKYGVWFHESISLLLADPDSKFGKIMNKGDIYTLLGSKKIKSVIGIQACFSNLLQDWTEIFPENYVHNEVFYLNKKKYASRKKLFLDDSYNRIKKRRPTPR
jgi:hypothetical protein